MLGNLHHSSSSQSRVRSLGSRDMRANTVAGPSSQGGTHPASQTLAQTSTRVSNPTSLYESIEIMGIEDGVVRRIMLAPDDKDLIFANPLARLMLACLNLVLTWLESMLAWLEIMLALAKARLPFQVPVNLLSPFRMFLGYAFHHGGRFFSLYRVWFNVYRLPSDKNVATSQRSLWRWTLRRMRKAWNFLIMVDSLIMP